MYRIDSYLTENFPNINGTEVLWPSSDNSAVKNYAEKILNSPANPAGDFGLLIYGGLDTDSYNTITSTDGNVFPLVGTKTEYYFTDMVFIQQKYEQAVFDLYCYRAESACGPWKADQGLSLRSNIDSTIQNTYWVAEKNGVMLDQEIFDAKIDSLLDDYFAERITIFNNEFQDKVPNIAEFTELFMQDFKAYYLDPSVETFDKFIQTAIDIGDQLTFEQTGRRDFWRTMVSLLCGSLGFNIIRYVSTNKHKFSFDIPQSSETVTRLSEASLREMELVFRNG